MNENIEKLSASDISSILSFANFLYSNNPFDTGAFNNPVLVNQNLIDLYNNPSIPTKDKLAKALSNYKYTEEELQAYSDFMSAFDMLYNRLAEYYANMLAFDLDITCKNAFTKEEFQSKEYKDDLKRVYKFFDNFDYVSEFRKVTKDLLRHETDFVWMRDTKGNFTDEPMDVSSKDTVKTSKYTLQTMPQSYCKITGTWENGFLYDFDMTYFLNSGTSITSYAPVFKRYYSNFAQSKQKYDPNAKPDKRNGMYSYWQQTSPTDGAWCFKFDTSNVSCVPFLVPMIESCLTRQEVEKLQLDKDMISAKAILAGEIQVMNDQKSGKATDAMVYNMPTLLKLLALVKKGLTNNINAVAMPTKDPKMYQYSDDNKTLVTDTIKYQIGQGVGASRLIYADDKMSQSELENAILTDYNIVKKLYSQFSNFLSFYVNKKTKKYKFRFRFDGSSYLFERQSRQKALADLADKGIVLNPSAWASVYGYSPQHFSASMIEGSACDEFNKSLLILLNRNTSKDGGSSEGGRPKMDGSEISDAGAVDREYD